MDSIDSGRGDRECQRSQRSSRADEEVAEPWRDSGAMRRQWSRWGSSRAMRLLVTSHVEAKSSSSYDEISSSSTCVYGNKSHLVTSAESSNPVTLAATLHS